MSSERDSTDDLVVLARRRGLSDAEQRRLREVLSASVETRLLHEAGLAFDREAPVVAGDDARIERIVRQVQKGSRRPREGRWWLHVAQGAAAGMLLASAAAAAIGISTSFFRSKNVDSLESGTPTAKRGMPAPPRSPTGAPASSAGDDPIAPKTRDLSPLDGDLEVRIEGACWELHRLSPRAQVAEEVTRAGEEGLRVIAATGSARRSRKADWSAGRQFAATA